MKKRKILYFLPVFSLLLTGCDFASIMDKAKDLGGKIVNPIKDLINPDKEGDNGEGGGNQEGEGGNEEGGGGEEQQVVAVSIKELIGVPPEIVQGETLAASSLKATVIYSDNTSKDEDVTKVELDTSKVGQTTGKAYVNTLVIDFTINVKAKEEHHEDDKVDYGTEENPLSVTKAVELIQKECKEDGDMTKQAITLVGEVSEIKNTFTYPSGPCFELYLVDGTSTAYFYRVHATEEQAAKVAHGAVVKAVGYAKNYKGTLEFVDKGDDAQCHMLSVVASEVTITSIKGVTGPETIEIGETLDLSKVKVSVVYSDGAEAVIAPDSVDLNTEEAGVQTAVAHVGQLTKEFTIEVIEKQPDPLKDVYFHKISSQEELIEGNYLIESNGYVFDGQDVAKSCPTPSIANNYILGGEGMAAIAVAAVEGGYSLKVLNGKNKDLYLSPASKNGITFSETPVVNEISFNDGVPTITSGGKFFNFNDAKDQLRFRYFSNAQKPVSLYVAGEGPAPVVPTLSSISATMTKVEYTEGDQLSLEGLVITGHYTDESEVEITEGISTSLEEGHVLALTDTALTVSVGEISCEIALTVKEKVVMTSISADMTSKIYTEGDTLSLAGLVVKGHYSDGTEAAISEGYTTSLEEGAELSVENTEVVVYFETFTASISIVVNPKQEEGAVLESISLSDDKVTVYHVGDELIKPTVTAHFDKGDDQIVEADFDGFNSSAASEKQTITVSYTYEGVTKSETYDVEIREIPVLDKIEISGEFETEYAAGDVFNSEGVVVTAVYTSDGESVDVTDKAVFPEEALTEGQETIIVSYTEGEKTVTETIDITVSGPRAIVQEGTYEIQFGEYYLSSVEGSKGQPTATTDESKAVVFDFVLEENSNDQYKIKVHGENEYLYFTDDNNGVRIGSTAAVFTITASEDVPGALIMKASDGTQDRYLSQYNNADFRCYKTTSSNNAHFDLTVKSVVVKDVKSIEIKQNPTKMTYYVGEAFDPTGMIVTVTYTDDTTEDITEGFTFEGSTGFQAANPNRTVKITYKTHNAYVQGVAVIEDERVQSGIEFAEDADMTEKSYKEGDSWNAAGLTVNDVYSNGDSEAATEGVSLSFNPAAPAVGTTSVTVTATKEGFEPVSKTITGITVAELPKNVDEITAEALGVTTNSYSNVVNKTLVSGAKFNGKIAKHNTNGVIQFNNAEKGLYTVDSLRILNSVSLKFNSNTGASNKIEIYAKRGNFASTQDTEGAKLVKTFEKNTDEQTFTFDDVSEATGYTNILIRATAAVYLDELKITWSEKAYNNFVYDLSLDKSEASINVGETLTLIPSVSGSGENYDSLNWSSDDESKVTVDNGVLTAVAVTDSPVAITATSAADSSKSVTCLVSVKAARTFVNLTTEGAFENAYTTDDSEFAVKDLKVYANYDNGDKEEVTDYNVTWSVSFNATLGNHSSTPTVHWNGHDLTLEQLDYNVASAAAVEVELKATTLTTPTGLPDGAKESKDKTGTASICGTSMYFERVTYNSPSTEGGSNGYFMFRTKKDADRYGSSDAAGKAFLANAVATSKAITKIEIDITSGSSSSAKYGVVVGSQQITSFSPSATYTSATGVNGTTITFNITEENMTYFAVGCTTTSYNGQIAAIRVYTK